MREKLIELMQTASSTCPDGIHKCPDCEYYEKDAFGNPCNDRKRIADVLIANGVTIPVRCKDCVLYQPNYLPGLGKYDNCGICERYPFLSEEHKFRTETDFCSYGERRTDE